MANDRIPDGHKADCAYLRGGCCTCGAPMTLDQKVQSNTWDHLNDFLAVWNARRAGKWEWFSNSDCKYVELRIDMRNGGCIIKDRHGKRIDPKDLAHQYGADAVASPEPPADYAVVPKHPSDAMVRAGAVGICDNSRGCKGEFRDDDSVWSTWERDARYAYEAMIAEAERHG